MPVKYEVYGLGAKEAMRGSLVIYEKWIRRKNNPKPGELVEISYKGETIGCGLWDGAGNVGLRILSREECYYGDSWSLIQDKLFTALRTREKMGLMNPKMGFRLVNSDGDLLSGLIIDIYNDIAVLQSSSLAIDVYLKDIAKWLTENIGVHHVFEKSTQRSRKDIGLPLRRRWIVGGKKETIIEELGVKFIVNVVEGQKTGFFLDQRSNRSEFGSLAGKGDIVLDIFSYTGGFGLHAWHNGASRITFVEEDPVAVDILKRNASLNGLRNPVIINKPFRDSLPHLKQNYDMVAIDPPAFIQRGDEKSIKKGLSAYRKTYTLGSNLVKRGGILFLSSCSYFLTRERFSELVSAVVSDKNSRILGSFRGADRDHVLGVANYLEYLKAAFILVE